MNSIAIANIISNNQAIDSVPVTELKALADKYPYTQLFAILYLKSLSVSKSFLLEEELTKYAYRITDKVKLYEIIHAKESLEEYTSVKQDLEEIEKVEILAETVESEEKITADVINAEEDTIVEQTPLETEISSPINVADEVTLQKDTSEESVDDLLETSILTNAIDNAFTTLIMKEVVAENEAEEVVPPVYAENTETVEENPEIILEEKDSLQTFSGWLSFGGEQKTGDEKPVEIEKSVPETKKNDLINQFIEKNPSISRPKKEFFSAPKKAQESVKESGLLYSETLANIYVLQGNFPLAIKAYEQLCLTIPEKRLIFAKKIEELKNKITNLK